VLHDKYLLVKWIKIAMSKEARTLKNHRCTFKLLTPIIKIEISSFVLSTVFKEFLY